MNAKISHPSIFESALVVYARRFPIRRGKIRIISSFWRVAAGNRGTHRLADLKYGGFKMTCDLSEMSQRQFYFFGTYFLDEESLRCWENEAKGAKVIFDVGANVGIFSLAALGAQPDAIVYAFEPTPEIVTHLRETATLNNLDQLRIHEVAVLNKSGHATLRRFRGELGSNGGMNFISTEDGESKAERVQTVCLDKFCRDEVIDQIDLMKIDTQGHEHSVLMGAEHLLKEGRVGIIFMELNWAENPGAVCPASESIRLLEKAGYRFSAQKKRLDWKKSGEWMRSLADIIARRV